jgi:ABC-type Na+ efflux pump permease subunit
MMLMFMAIMVGATPLVQTVLEEKMAKISEVLLGSIPPFQLMLGKLLGTVGVSVTLVSFYLAGAFFALWYAGYSEYFPSVSLLIWVVLFQILAVLMYGSLFSAVGAAVSDMKEAQSTMLPVMIIAMSPMFIWIQVVQNPSSRFSLFVSLFPPATPMLMVIRQSVPPGVPTWQPVLGIVLVLLTTLICVFCAGRIFRVGVLIQGKGASYWQMLQWIVRG